MRAVWLCRRARLMCFALVCPVVWFVLVAGTGVLTEVWAERVFGDDVLVSGEPVGTQWHGTHCSGQRAVSTTGDSVFVIWAGQGPEGSGVYLNRSLDGGENFEAPVRVNDIGINGSSGSLAADQNNNLYAVWYDKRDGDGPGFNIYFSRSTDGGETFGPDVRVDDAGDDPSWQTDPAIAVDDSGTIYVVWLDERGNGQSGVYFSRSLDGGASFDSSLALPNPDGDAWPQSGPSVTALAGDRVCVSYFDWRHRDGSCPIFACVRHSDDGGETFSEPVDLDNCGSVIMQTSICSQGGSDVYAAWAANEDYCRVSRSYDGGETFGPYVQVNDKPARLYVAVSIWANSSGWVVVAWEDSTNVLGFSESSDYGATFSPPTYLEGSGDRRYPTVAIDGSCTVYLAWTDYRHSTKGDIYFSKGILDPPAGIGDGVCGDLPYGLVGAGPNPFKQQTRFQVDKGLAITELEIFDLRGRKVCSLPVCGGLSRWDGCDGRGALVAPGVYLVVPRGEGWGHATKVVRCD